MAKLTEAQHRQIGRARRAFESVRRDAERLSNRIERLFPGAFGVSGNDDPAPEVIIGLGQARAYCDMALALSDYGMDEMLARFATPSQEATNGR